MNAKYVKPFLAVTIGKKHLDNIPFLMLVSGNDEAGYVFDFSSLCIHYWVKETPDGRGKTKGEYREHRFRD